MLNGTDEEDIDSAQFENIIRSILFKLSFLELNPVDSNQVKFSRAFREIARHLGADYDD